MTIENKCRLRKGDQIVQEWIPSNFAKAGNTVYLNGDYGWKVLSVGEARNLAPVRKNKNRRRSYA